MLANKLFRLFLVLCLVSKTLQVDAQVNKKTKEDVFGIWGHGPDISDKIIGDLPFIKGWNFTFAWKDLEPRKGQFNWALFDKQLTAAANNDLYIGFMVWVGQNAPEWVYTQDGVPKVEVIDPQQRFTHFPYYFSDAYKADYRHLLQSIFDHIKTMPPKVRDKVLFWMSAEGSTGDEGPYKGTLKNPQYDISMKAWFDFKKEVWSYMYNEGKKLNPQLNILINQANNGMYLDWLLQNTPTCWFKAGSLAHTYSFTREQDYYERLKAVVRPDNNGLANRFRSESEELQQLGWFKQSPQQNSFALMSSAICIGLDMMNVRKNAVKEAEGNEPFLFFNKYAGQRDPSTASGAFCVLRDVLDVVDTVRFPTKEFGRIVTDKTQFMPGRSGQVKRLEDVNPERTKKILEKFKSQGAQSGPSKALEEKLYSNDDKLPVKLRKNTLRPDLMDKYNNDMGIYLIPDNYNHFITQYKPNQTSEGHWRVGPVNQLYGRYARGFNHAKGMDEMWFSLDQNFFKEKNAPQKVKINIAYFDDGDGEWSLNYSNGKEKVEKYKVKCKNSKKWITKEVVLDNFCADKKLNNQTDFSIKYLSGSNTIFSLIELTRL